MKNKSLLLSLLLFLFSFATSWAAIGGSGTQSDPYTINSTSDWNTFASNVGNGTTYQDKHIKLTADITVSTMVGTSSNKFKGVFDGGGHTLTVNYDVTEAYVAPFRYVDGVTVKNLHVAGTIKTSNQFAGGLMAEIYGNSSIINCWSSVTITSSWNGNGTHGGFIGATRGSSSVIFWNCRFDGLLLGSTTISCGGFAGWHDGDGRMEFYNCLFVPSASFTIDSFNSATFSRNGVTRINNSYYTTAFGSAQGTQTSATGDELAALLGSGWEVKDDKVVPVSDAKNLGIASITGLPVGYVYTGSVIPISYTVTAFDGMMLSENTHYTASISPSTVREPGEYTLTITAKDGSGYIGSQTNTFSVIPDGLSVDEDYLYSELGYFYVNMPKTGSKTVTLTNDAVTSFKVYDDGGKNDDYSIDCDAYLTIIAPQGYVVWLTDTVQVLGTTHTTDYLTVYDGLEATDSKHLGNERYGYEMLSVRNFTSVHIGEDVGLLASSSNSMTLYFHSGHYDVASTKGLDLTVRIVRKNDIKNALVTGMRDRIMWNYGSPIDFGYSVANVSNIPLTEGTDYTATIRDEEGHVVTELKDLGTYTLILEGVGDYAGSKTIHFTVIDDIPITSETYTLEDGLRYVAIGNVNYGSSLKNFYVYGDVILNVAEGATLTVNNRIILKDGSNLTINLAEGATLNANHGISVTSGNSLTINGSGTLNATGTTYNAGIGGTSVWAGAGAFGEISAQAIQSSTHGHITINGGTINARGGDGGAGIGGGNNSLTDENSIIEINGGVVNATAGVRGSGIGGGNHEIEGGQGGTIIIRGGQVTARKSDDTRWKTFGIGDGKGADGSGTSLTIGLTNVGDFIDADSYKVGSTSLATTRGFSAEGTRFVVLPGESHFFDGDGTLENPYRVYSDGDWGTLGLLTLIGFEGKHVKQFADFSTSHRIGSVDVPFKGIYDGNGHTLTVNYETAENYDSPFRSVMNATIAFLHVTGTIQSGHQKIGGLVGYLQGNSNKIENCWSSVTINSKYGGEGYVSGFVGCMWMNDRLTIRNCRFDGKLLDGSGSDTDGSGFVAYKFDYTDASVQNCLFIPAELEDSETWIGYDNDKKSRDFAYTYTTVQNCYYTRTYNANKGSTAVGSMTNAELATALGSGWTVSEGKVVPTTSYKNLDVCSFDNVENFYEYTGSPIAIDYEVKDNLGHTLVKGSDYTETFTPSPIQGMGKYTLTVTGKGDYTGSLSKTFNVFYNLPGSGTSKDPYLIESANDWDCFGDNIANGVPGYDGAYYKLVNDISVTTMVGSADRPFRGSFDGNGKTLTVAYGSADSPLAEDYIAPFRRTDRATIKNLHVAGNIYMDGKFAGGLVAELKGDASFNSCWSSVVITSGKSGDGSHGGFIGVARGSSTVAFHNCRFDGQLLGSSTNSSGGFVGWHEGSVKFGNSLFAPSATVTIGTDNSATFSRNGVTGVYNCYYTVAFGDVQGTAAGSKTEAQLAAALGAGWELKNGKAVPVIGYRPTAPEGMDVDDLFIENEVGYYYVNMPTQGSKELTLDISLKSFKVYDEGGKTGNYGDNRDRSLIFTIPEGYKLRWSGSISTHGNDDYLVFYDITNSPVQLSGELYGNLTFHSLEYNYNVRKIMQYFHTEGSYSEAGGFDFTVEVLDAVTQWPIEIASVTGGTMESNVNESLEGETIFLTDHPEDGYLLNSFTVTDAAGEEVPFTGGKIWYDGTLKTFYMPGSKVTVTPAFIHAVTAEDGLAIDLPESGIVAATIPSAVKSFKVNYKHAVYDATTNLILTAPEGYVLKLSGNVSAQVDNASSISYVVYDGEYWEAPQLITERAYTGSFNKDYMGVVSSGKSMFVTISSLSRGYGVDWDAELKIELVKADTYHDITVSNTITHGKVAIDKNSALLGEVVTVNVTPDEGFVLEKISVTDDNGDILLTPENPDVTWGDFSYYTSNEFTFKMRISDAKVNATFISKADFYVNMPKTGQLDITIDSEDAISSFHVYDNSGVNGYYVSNDYGKLLITAPEGYVMSVSGYVKLYKTSNDEDYLDVYDGNSTAATKLGRFKNTVRNGYYDDNLNYHDTPTTPVAATSRGNQLLLHFVTNNSGYVSSNGGVYLTVTLKGISIAAIPDQTYTGSAICPAVSVTDGENPLELGVDYTIKCMNNVSAGTAQMTVTGIGGYTGFGPITKSFKIIPKEITVAWSEQISFVYNGTEQAPTATAEGLLNGDKCTIAVSGATVAGKHTATATDLSNGNYKLPTENLEKEFTIAKASLMVTAKNKTIAYGDEPANGGVEYAGFVGEESASVLGGTLAYEYNYVKGNATGEYSITPSGLTADNYEIEFVAGKLTVEPKEISIAWGEQTLFVYNGLEQVPTAIAEGVVDGDDCTITVSGAAKDVGTYTATATVVCSDDCKHHYKLPTENLEKEFTIAKASLTVTAKNKTIAYGDEPANDGIEYAGFASEEGASVLNGTLAYEYNYVQGDPPGEYSITPSGLTADNYEIEFVAGKLTVEPKEITIAWGEQTSFVYNGMEQAPMATAEGLLNSDECSITVSGATVAGKHTATVARLNCGSDNYKLPTETEKEFTIAKASLTVTAKNKTIAYGDEPANGGVEYAGFVGEESASVLGGTLAYEYNYVKGNATGEYSITPSGLTADNYEIEFVAGKLIVEPKEITIAWGELTLFVYNGTEQAPMATAEGVVDGDDCTITVFGAAKEIGTYTATTTVVCNDDCKRYYKLPTENFEKSFVITPKEITIAWGEQTLFYNGTEQAPAATAEGLVKGDYCSIAVSGAATDVGTYTATAASLNCNKDNYKLPTENLEITFEITKSNLAALKRDLVVQDGDVLTGTLAGNYQISIADGATVTLNGVTIIGDNNSSYKWAGITCQGDCNIILAENSENTVKGFYEEYPGFYVPYGKTLAISGTGSLDASSNGKAAGIGGGYYGDAGNIEISGGTITATGGAYAAGIGGGTGKVKGNVGSVGSISISGNNTKVTAIKGEYAPYSIGKSGYGSRNGTITIGGIETSDIETSPFVYQSNVTNLAVLRSDLVVQDGGVLTGTLAGNYQISIADGATVTLNGVTISGVNSRSYKWAGITCQGDCNIILAENSENTVKGFHEEYSGIYVPYGKTLTISGTGSLDASSNGKAAGIGGGYYGDAGNIEISGGTITATGGAYAAGIGGGTGKVKGGVGKVGSISISGNNTKVTAIKGEYAPYSIGKSGYGSRTGTITIGGIETSDIETSTGTFKYPYLMLVYEDDNGKHAVLNGEYSGDESVNITEDIKHVAVTFNRVFTPNSGYATIMLPFDVNATKLTGVRSVIEFDGIKTDKNDNKMVGMRYVWCNATLGEQEELNKHPNCNGYSGELKAYTPYMIEMESATLGIKDAVTLKSNSGKIVGDAPVGNWVFRGTLQKKEWPKGTGIINEGRLWAFSAAERSGAKIGEFVQFGGNNWANPFRAYLVECKKSGEDSWDCQDDSEPQPKASQVSRYRFADALAPTNSAEKLAGAVATDEPLVLRQAAASETASLSSMDIVIVYGDKDSDQERPTVIGRFNPATGEIRMLPRTKQTYDLKGRKVGNGKKAKGAYYRR